MIAIPGHILRTYPERVSSGPRVCAFESENDTLRSAAASHSSSTLWCVERCCGFGFAVVVTGFEFAMAMRRLVASTLRGRSFCSSSSSSSAGPAQLGGVQDLTKPASTHGEIGEVSGIPEEHLKRKVVIYSPSRCTTQSGPASNKWKISFESVNKWENPLMGWTSTGDPYHSVGEASLNFDSKERAVEFAEKYGWQYTVREPHQTVVKPKAYADNFKWKGPVPEYD